MIQASMLPRRASVYDPPTVFPGQELTEEQQEQLTLAQIAATVAGVATAKAAVEKAVTNQIVLLLRTADLTTEPGIKAFAKVAAKLVGMGVRKAQEITWAGVSARARIVGISFSEPTPVPRQIPPELRFSRGTDLETAYRRLAREYQENKKRTADDPVIKKLVRELEDANLTPLPRPDNISNDAVERISDGEEEWTQAFQKASEAEGGENPEGPSDEEVARQEARRRAREEQEQDLQRFADEVERSKQQRREQSEALAEPPETITLTQREVDEVIDRYAEQKAEERAERMVGQDIAGASRNIHNHAINKMDKKLVTGYRRVIHPELSKSGHSCGLCIVASTMRYKRSDLLPIHSGCNCETVEIYSIDGREFDPGQAINEEDLSVFYDEAGGSTHGWDLKRSRYRVENHPEYGPTLVNVSDKKRTESIPYGD